MQERLIYTEPELTLEQLARLLGTSRHTLSAFLNDTLGCGYYSYLERFRVAHAVRLLRSCPGKSILEIAYDSGFGSKATFNRRFKAATGQPPSSLRQLC